MLAQFLRLTLLVDIIHLPTFPTSVNNKPPPSSDLFRAALRHAALHYFLPGLRHRLKGNWLYHPQDHLPATSAAGGEKHPLQHHHRRHLPEAQLTAIPAIDHHP